MSFNENNKFGFAQWCNFGKHKGNTFYDIANAGDFGYLKWLLKRYSPTNDSIKLNENCKDHIIAALQSENHPWLTWAKFQSELDEYGSYTIDYKCEGRGDLFTGPSITMYQCGQCGKHKNSELFNQDYICSLCQKLPKLEEMKETEEKKKDK